MINENLREELNRLREKYDLGPPLPSLNEKLPCIRDTDGDGDCGRCAKHGGCPFAVFRPCHIDRAIMDEAEVREFKRNAEKFEYREWLGTVKGWRSPDGRVLIEQIEPK